MCLNGATYTIWDYRLPKYIGLWLITILVGLCEGDGFADTITNGEYFYEGCLCAYPLLS